LAEKGDMRQADAALGAGQPWANVLLTITAVGCAVALGVSRQFYDEALVDAFFGLALASVAIIHLRIRPKWMDAALIAAGTGVLGVMDFAILRYPPRVMAWFSFLGLASFCILSVRGIWEADRSFVLSAWVPAALFVVSDYFADVMLAWTSRAHPRTLDLFLLSFDGSLGVQPAFEVGRYYTGASWFHVCALIAYIGLALPIAMVYAGRLVRFRQAALPVMYAFLIVGPVGIVLYNFFPACGPHSLFGPAFPFRPFPLENLPRLVLEPVAIPGPRNAMPSLHLAWTLLAWWYSKGLSWIERAVAFAFLAWTVMATLGTGEHWFADLIVAFPFALAIQAVCASDVSWKDATRQTALALGLGGTACWLIALRYAPKLFWMSPLVPWTLSAATIALVSWRQMGLDRAAMTGNPLPSP
jgi:hypothetical protein